MLHDLRATPETVHWGYFNATQKPALTIKSGDFIRAEAVTHHAGDAPDLMMDDAVRAIYEKIPHEDRNPGVHIMTGPIHVEGAKPGDMLEVRYLQMIPRFRFGANVAAHWGQLYEDFKKERVTIYELDNRSNTAHALFAFDYPGKLTTPGKLVDHRECCKEPALAGVRVPVRPHLGTAGVAPDAQGRVSTVEPGLHGGNIDNWRIGAGATMYYRVQVDGGLFSIGDPHISQGDGEISGTAIEASLNVLFQIVLRKDFEFPSPLLETPDAWIVHGFHQDLDEAGKNAARDMIHLLTEQQGLSRDDAYSLMSVAADFGVTQVVDGTQGVHCTMPRSMFPPKSSKS
ncbi:formamidase [Pandoraea morbifera]|uniref:Formamidase n=1 Tax=Pandoraea morbifera TaxID=2508300 RepID=A0A5E4VT21_9BURK|nr:acetamidase/formamidase family protein [Pandoraea morbifera]VVE15391.1 formamidase [Pandoraea morbifera]